MPRGVSTIYGEKSPLFVVDSQRVGTSLRDLELVINVVDIANICFMKGQNVGNRYEILAGSGAYLYNLSKLNSDLREQKI